MLLEKIQSYKDEKNYSDAKVIEALAHVIDNHCDKKCYDDAIREVHEHIYGKHFNEEFADKAVSEFFYIDEDGGKIYGPFITKDKCKEYFNDNSRQINSEVNFYDFYVALNKVMSDHKKLLQRWFPNDTQIYEKCVELTLSCINDDDYNKKGCKIWNHVNQDYLK